jgi:Domain of Unknown Function (DUF1080)
MKENLAFAFIVSLSLALAHAEEIPLFNGKDLSGWQEPHGTWSVVGSVALAPDKAKAFTSQPGQGVLLCGAGDKTNKMVNIVSTTEHGDAQIHVEFNVPTGSNSGLYIQGRYEIQVYDSFGKDPVSVHDCGALYERWDPKRGKGNEGYEGHTPRVNASKPAGEWQTFDITFRAPRFDADGKKTENAKFIKVMHNGQLIHENVELNAPTRGAKIPGEAATGPMLIQGNHGSVAYRKLTIAPLVSK